MAKLNRADLKTKKNQTIYKNGKKEIKGELHNAFLEDVLDSLANLITDAKKLNIYEYDSSLEYNVGVGVLYQGALYQANTVTGLGAFNASDWDLIASDITASNGLTKVGDDIKLGGTLTEDTFIEAKEYSIVKIFEATFDNILNNNTKSESSVNNISVVSSFDNNTNEIIESSVTQKSNAYAVVISDGSLIHIFGLVIVKETGYEEINLGKFDINQQLLEGIYFDKTDNRFKATSTNLTPSLTELITYENLTTALNNITASNGLTKVGDDIKLGGNATEDTSLSFLDFFLQRNFSSTGNTNTGSITEDNESLQRTYTFATGGTTYTGKEDLKGYDKSVFLKALGVLNRRIGVKYDNTNVATKLIKLGQFSDDSFTQEYGIYFDTATNSFNIENVKANNVITNPEIPAWQNVKTYVDDRVVSSIQYQGGYDATTNPASLSALKGYMYTVTVAGNFGGFWNPSLEIGDVIIAEINNPTVLADWTVVNKNLDANSILASLLTVDGPGSGLDADLLDGLQGADFFRQFTSSLTSVDLNDIKSFGSYRVNINCLNMPQNVYLAMIVYGNTGTVITQQATHHQTGETWRRSFNTVWGAWRKVVDSENIATRSFILDNPSASSNRKILRTSNAVTVTRITATVRGSSSPTCTFSIVFGTDRTTATGTLVSSTTVTNTTTGQDLTLLLNGVIPANNHVWVQVSGVGGGLSELELDLKIA